MGTLMLSAVFAPASPTHAAEDQRSAPQECVVLLHGLGRTHRSMERMAAALQAAGFQTFNPGYPSRKRPIETLAMQTIPPVLQQCRSAGCGTIHFVTHSMGGLLVRYYLSREKIADLGRVVMLSPPNQGSEASDALRGSFFYRWYNGPAGQQLGTGPEGIAATLGSVTYPVGVLTGNVHHFFDGWLSAIIPGEDDGKVAVERAKVTGMTDFLVLPYSHSFIMAKEATIAQTLHFLRHGAFQQHR
jgi:triacylglycerol lipase